jgi:uncharacterized phiE125 gp8 family phage protein
LLVGDAKPHLRVTWADEDDVIERLIVGARGEWDRAGIQLITATWKLKLDRFPWYREPIDLRPRPLLTVVSVKYRDPDDVLQTWASSDYVVDAPAGPVAPVPAGRVYPALNKEYPSTACRPDAVEIEFTAGYGAEAENVPQDIRDALLDFVGHRFQNREPVNIGNIVTPLPYNCADTLASYVGMAALIR